MDAYEQKRAAERARTAEVRAKIVQALKIIGEEPERKPHEEDSNFARVSSARVFCSYSSGYGTRRIEVRCNTPRHADGSWAGDVYYTQEERAAGLGKENYGKVSAPSITISPEKSAEQIAKDIQRRFLPDCIKYIARVQECIDARNDYQSATVAALVVVKGAALTEYEAKERKISEYLNETKGGESYQRYTATASRDRIDLEIHDITAQQAREIIDALRK